MDKAIQAVDITAVKAVSKDNSQANGGETTPFAQLLTPAQAEAEQAQVATTGTPGGNHLPEEAGLPQEQPGQAALDTAEVLQELPGLAVTEVDAGDGGPVDGEEAVDATQVSVPLVELTAADVAPENVPVSPVAAGKPDAPAVERPVIDVVNGLPKAEPVVTTAVNSSREAIQAEQRAGVVQVAVSQPATGTVNTAVDDAQAAVRAGVQQAVAAQVSQEGLRQSLSGNRQQNPASSRAVTGTAVDTAAAAGFTTLLTEASATSAGTRVAVPVGEAGWARAVGEQVVWHVSQNIQSANLRLNPQHLGPLEMQLQMDGDKATLAFASQHAAVRDALESALPRLREMFAQNGLDIVDVNVSQQNTPGREEQQAAGGRSTAASDEAETSGEQRLLQSGSSPVATGLVDYYV